MIRSLFHGLIGQSGATTRYECRHCGTAVDDSADVCPQCGHGGVAVYQLE